MTLRLFDTHAHLADPKIGDDVADVLARAEGAGVVEVLALGYDLPSSERSVELAQMFGGRVLAAVGLHPHEADSDWQQCLPRLRELAAAPEVVAIGEVGLDAYRGWSSEANQRRLLEAQLDLALAVRKPVCVHSRAAEDAALAPLTEFARAAARAGMAVPGVMHCFGGTLEQAQPYIELGFLVSIAGPITYPKNDVTRQLAAALPARSLVIETDTPYLPPQSMRGKRNEPAYIVETARAVAAARGVSAEEIASLTTENARRAFARAARQAVR
ncbi:MAG: TatD-related deoxyribonuclease [Tepidiforma sp.]|nr:MAG: TatD-related deoxyribonuclease [Tepidiforma sp.]